MKNKIKVEYKLYFLNTGHNLDWFSTDIPEDTPINNIKSEIVKANYLKEFHLTKEDIIAVRINY